MGNRYGAPFLDMRQGTSEVGFIASKDKFPTALRSYKRGNDGCDFAGGALDSDNEIVLNSTNVGLVLKDFDTYHSHQQLRVRAVHPTKRHMRTLREPMRVMHERGGACEEYW
eukprot:1884307-Pleurochrysis_carterae.AAC.1